MLYDVTKKSCFFNDKSVEHFNHNYKNLVSVINRWVNMRFDFKN